MWFWAENSGNINVYVTFPVTLSPTIATTSPPTLSPTLSPTPNPTSIPSYTPTTVPSSFPTDKPTDVPTEAPMDAPTQFPTISPTSIPTVTPTQLPSNPSAGQSAGSGVPVASCDQTVLLSLPRTSIAATVVQFEIATAGTYVISTCATGANTKLHVQGVDHDENNCGNGNERFSLALSGDKAYTQVCRCIVPTLYRLLCSRYAVVCLCR